MILIWIEVWYGMFLLPEILRVGFVLTRCNTELMKHELSFHNEHADKIYHRRSP